MWVARLEDGETVILPDAPFVHVFAARGMGFFAAATGGEDLAPVESFAVPPAAGTPTGTIGGRVTDALTGAPVSGANVGVAGLGGLAATTAADGTYTIPGVPQGTYVKVLAIGPGHEASGSVDLTMCAPASAKRANAASASSV